MKAKKRKPGRPKGSKTAKRAVIRTVPKRCPRLNVLSYRGTAPDGLPYTHVVRHRAKCQGCGQCFVTTTYENRVSLNLNTV